MRKYIRSARWIPTRHRTAAAALALVAFVCVVLYAEAEDQTRPDYQSAAAALRFQVVTAPVFPPGLPDCPTEDTLTGPCVWDATRSDGDRPGLGESFWIDGAGTRHAASTITYTRLEPAPTGGDVDCWDDVSCAAISAGYDVLDRAAARGPR